MGVELFDRVIFDVFLSHMEPGRLTVACFPQPLIWHERRKAMKPRYPQIDAAIGQFSSALCQAAPVMQYLQTRCKGS